MDKNFSNLKRKALIAAIIKSAVSGLSAGLATVGALLLGLTLGGKAIHWGFYILIGLGCALLVGGLLFVFLRPTDVKIAKKYDKEFGLGEKLQTMVEFSGQDGDIISLQRDDAEQKLSDLPKVKVKFKRIWQYVVCGVLAVCIFVSGVTVTALSAKNPSDKPGIGTPGGDNPGGETPPDEENAAFEYDLYMQADMATLIGEVRDSAVEEGMRDFMVSTLEGLDESLKSVTTRVKMLETVFAAVASIDMEIERVNSFRKISDGINEFDANLAYGIKNGFAAYKDRIVRSMPLSYVRSLATGIGDYIETGLEKYLTDSCKALEANKITYDDTKPLSVVLGEQSTNLKSALTLSGFGKEDALYECLDTLSTQLLAMKLQAEDSGTAQSIIWGRMEECYGIMQSKAIDALAVQNFKAIMEVYIRQRLADILDISFGGLVELYYDLTFNAGEGGSTTPGEGGDEEDPGHGGAGSGDVLFGSDDLVYDPITGTFRKFGEILDDYEGALLNGTINEEIPEYLRKYFENYLNYLHNGTGDKNGTQN